ncbi:translation elongation factor [Oxynema sp. CENA135]|uniref:type II restriction enzyme n=1 Tax=Oxynema sp. CENA135 TaxID=984206 RepID=UPI00190B2246|nr:translation elongation factor [Oxynema sp. CENA135]MBK4729235.1 translation elongation factor [Oxynema sp. CENA135]
MTKKSGQTKNDIAWEKLFNHYDILNEIERFGFYEIDSSTINQHRESRLMAKFDHIANLPKVFEENKLSILPISRYKYKIGHFKTHQAIENQPVEPTNFQIPDLETINYRNLYSENAALLFAFNSGIIDDLLGEKTCYTIAGRMSTGSFTFRIEKSIKKPNESKEDLVDVVNSQCEIDGGFESDNYLILIEAKNYAIDDFLIRQLYYPCRLWINKVSKKVIPVLMSYSNDVFNFYIYDLKDDLRYNSLLMTDHKIYKLAPESITIDDLFNIFQHIKIIVDPGNIPFPQADKFERVIDLVSLLVDRDLTKDEITENYQFNARQTNYYTDAGRYLGLIDKYSNPFQPSEKIFKITNQAKEFFTKSHKEKYLFLMRKILEHEVFYKAFEATKMGDIPKKSEIVYSLSNSSLSPNTKGRRASTVRGWIEWIWSQITD